MRMKCFILLMLCLMFASASTAENLLPGDSSAEAGVVYLSTGGFSCGLVPVFHDKKQAFDGKASLRVDWDNKRHYGNKEYFTDKYFGFDMPELKRGQTYTISFYAKSDVDDFPVSVHLFPCEQWSKKYSRYFPAIKLSKEWKRYQFTFKVNLPVTYATTSYSCNLYMSRRRNFSKAGSAWFDAFQLETGDKATKYSAPVASADLKLVTGKAYDIVFKNDKVTAKVNCAKSSAYGNTDLEVEVLDWEGISRKKYTRRLESKEYAFPLPTDRFGWFNTRVRVISGGKIVSESTRNYIVAHKPVKIAKGLEPFCGVAGSRVTWDTSVFAAYRALGVRRYDMTFHGKGMWQTEVKKGVFDFTYLDFVFKHALANDLKIKFNIVPFDWPAWHFTKEEIAEMKKTRSRHTMFDMRHRKFWNDTVKTVLDRYGDKIHTIEYGGEDNGRLGINRYFAKKYPEGVQKDSRGQSWVVAGPAMDALCTLVSDALKQTRERFPKIKTSIIRPSQGRPGQPWFFVWKMMERLGKQFSDFGVDTYSLVPYYIGPGVDKNKRNCDFNSRFFTMDHAKRMLRKHGLDQPVYLSETGTMIPHFVEDQSPFHRERAEYTVKDMIAARSAGFYAYDLFTGITDRYVRGWNSGMNSQNGLNMTGGVYTAVAQIVENVVESKWMAPDTNTRIALFRKVDGTGVGAVWSIPGVNITIPAGIQVSDFMGNPVKLPKDRVLKLTGAAYYLKAKTYAQIVEKFASPMIEQSDFCNIGFRHITDKAGLIRFTNNSNMHGLYLDCIITINGKKQTSSVAVPAASYNSIRIKLPAKAKSIKVEYRKRYGDSKKYISETLNIPAISPIRSGKTPSSVLGRIETSRDILPYEPWVQWSGADDLGVVFSGSWTKENLVLRAVVADDKHFPSKNVNAPWEADCFQLAIDPMNNGVFFTRAGGKVLDADDKEMVFRLGKDGKVNCKVSAGGSLPGMKYSVKRDEKNGKTVYDVSIPWKTLGVKPVKGMVLGISAVFFDDDTGTGQEYRGLVGGGITGIKNPALYKKFTLQ